MNISDPAGAEPSFAEPRVLRLQDLLTFLMRGKLLILATTALIITTTAIHTFLTQPVYESRSLFCVDTKGISESLFFLDVMGGGTFGKITNEIEALKS